MNRLSYLDSLCQKVIALEYYDGPIAGVGFLADGRGVYFRLVAWDEEQWQRVFAVVLIPTTYVQDIWSAFAEIETPKEPLWCPSSDGKGEARSKIERSIDVVEASAFDSTTLLLVESRSLIGEGCVVSLTDAESKKVLKIIRLNKVVDFGSSLLIQEFLDWLAKDNSV